MHSGADLPGSIWNKYICLQSNKNWIDIAFVVEDYQKETFVLNEEQSCPFKLCQETFGQTKGLLEVHSLDRWIKNRIACNQNCHVWRKANTAYQAKNLISTVKYGGGNVKISGCFSASKHQWLHIIQRNMWIPSLINMFWIRIS